MNSPSSNDADDTIRRLLVESLDVEIRDRAEPDPELLAGMDQLDASVSIGTTRRRRSPRIAPWLAAAAAAVVGISIALVVSHSTDRSSSLPAGPGTSGVVVSCAASDGGAITADRPALLARARQLANGHSFDVLSGGGGSAITITVPGASESAAGGLCTSTSVEFRPLIAPLTQIVTPPAPDALTGLGFPVPTTQMAYDALTAAQRADLTRALGATKCSAHSAPGHAAVACRDIPGRASDAALLGPPILMTGGIADAQAIAPQSGDTVSTQWSVDVTLTPEAGAAWNTFTTAHNTGGVDANDAGHCSSTSTPCADYVAIVIDGTIVSLPVTEAALSTQTNVSGNFDERTATELANALRSGSLPVPLTVTSVKTVR